MASFTVDTDSENILCDTNVQQFCSPKVSEKDFSIYFPNSSDTRMQKLSSPINGLFEHDNSNISIAESEIKNDAETTIDSSVVGVTPEETPQERMEREERESQELAWQLMQQDNLDMYNMQLQFMQQNAGDMSEEDLRVMQELMNESNQQVLPTTSGTGEENEEDEEEEGDELNESDSSNWDYERLLQLGQQLGGNVSYLLQHYTTP